MEKWRGQSSYVLENDRVRVYLSVLGGHLTADFRCGEKTVNPYFVAPWWQEAPADGLPEMINVMRGDFFGFPFGVNDEPYEGKTYPVHGPTSNGHWEGLELHREGDREQMSVCMMLAENEGRVEKTIGLHAGEAVVYCTHRISGFQGKVPLGHHPILQLPDREGAAYLDMTEPVAGFTAPITPEDPRTGGYSRLRANERIKDRRHTPCDNGETVDLTRYPTPKGFEDVALFVSDASRDFTFTSLSLPEEGYVYFQLKNPRVLASTMLWMSNGGRHYAPWNGRVSSVIGLEEITSYYYYGQVQSVAPNPLAELGYKTHVKIDAASPCEVKFIMGVAPIGKDFKGIREIQRKDAKHIRILGHEGEELEVPCQVDFLM